jgi:ABC-type multidrug transport system fused ATPase/permease subunit
LIAAIFSILIPGEKIKLMKLVTLDIIIGALDIAFLGLMLAIIDFYTKSDSTKDFLGFNFANRDSLLLIIVFFLLFSVKNWFGYYVSSQQRYFFFGIASRLSKRNITQYMNEEYNHFVKVDSAIEIRVIGQQPIEFSNYILINIQQIISQGILIFFTVFGLLAYHPNLFFLLFCLLVPPVLALAYFVRRKLRDIRLKIKSTSEKTLQYLQEALSGFIEANIFQSATFFEKRYHNHQQKLNNGIAMQQSLQALPARMIEIFAVLGFLILLLINKFSQSSHKIDLLEVGVFMAAAYKIIPGIVKILNSTGQIKAYQFTITDLLSKNKALRKPQFTSEQIKSISFKGVSAQYKAQHNIPVADFELQKGDFLGVSGKSGIGKTTMINLLLGFLSPINGEILINHLAKTATERQAYWGQISYIKQQQFIFSDSILKNITLSETIDEDRLATVVAFCELENVTSQSPLGINLMLTEHGKNISGGQRQRIILARALYHDFDLLILDEAFSELDPTAEQRFLSKLKTTADEGKIIIMVTHNENALTFCNKIINIENEA